MEKLAKFWGVHRQGKLRQAGTPEVDWHPSPWGLTGRSEGAAGQNLRSSPHLGRVCSVLGNEVGAQQGVGSGLTYMGTVAMLTF